MASADANEREAMQATERRGAMREGGGWSVLWGLTFGEDGHAHQYYEPVAAHGRWVGNTVVGDRPLASETLNFKNLLPKLQIALVFLDVVLVV